MTLVKAAVTGNLKSCNQTTFVDKYTITEVKTLELH